jgi:hypothetical protein
MPLGVIQVLVEAHSRAALAQDAGKGRLPNLDRLPPHVGAVQLKSDAHEARGLGIESVTESPGMKFKGGGCFFVASMLHGLAASHCKSLKRNKNVLQQNATFRDIRSTRTKG